MATLIVDSFNRADNASVLGPSDHGGTWNSSGPPSGGGGWGISSNQAYVHTDEAAGDGRNWTFIDSGNADVTVQVTFANVGTLLRLVVRYSDNDNLIEVQSNAGTYELYKRVASSFSLLGSYTVTPANNDVLRITTSGDSIDVYLNTVLRISASDSFNNTATKHGIGTDGSGAGRFDDFSVTNGTAINIAPVSTSHYRRRREV